MASSMSILAIAARMVGVLGVSILGLTTATVAQAQTDWVDHSTSNNSTVTARHETGSVVSGNKLYVLGGRGNRPVQVFDSVQNKWSNLAPLPKELHHFQPVVVNGGLYVIGAFTCCYPEETNVSDIYRLDLASNNWQVVGSIPADRLRGSAGAVVRNNKIYLIGGNTNGHSGGAVRWFDEYNPATGSWTVLPDAPRARDHFSAAVVGNKLIAAAGRTTNLSFGGMIGPTDSYDFNTGNWSSVKAIPTPRAGAVIGVKNGNLIVMGGETDTQLEAHDEVEAYDVAGNNWRSLPALKTGRHGGAGGVVGNTLHAITGNTYRGGGQEVKDHETLNLSDSDNDGRFDFEDDSTGTGTNPLPLVDSDNDGLTDQEEATHQTNPQNRDSDNDSLSDGDEVNLHNTDPLKNDTDADGISDSEEIDRGTNPLKQDTDNDGLHDGDEISRGTNPLVRDSDSDGLSDGNEITRGTDPLEQDTDADGLLDAEEIDFGTNPLTDDTDLDGLSDIDELQTYSTDPTNPDSDGDTLKDQDELQIHFTDPLLADSDNDGLTDDAEILTYNSNPNAWDTDGDGTSDATEAAEGTNLVNPDQDGDGILNTVEGNGDLDGDSLPNYLDLDSDNDSIADIVENGKPDIDNNGRVDTSDNGTNDDSTTTTSSIQNDETQLFDSDGDGIPNMFDLDSDQDGLTDLAESGRSDPDNTGRLAADVFTDTNQDGWQDGIANPALDTDNDATPDYLDLDSDDDGIADSVEYGWSDLDVDADGRLDLVSDSNADGLHDSVAGVPPVTADEDQDGMPDAIDPEFNPTRASGGGCTISASTDPLLPMAALTVISLIAVRRRVRHKVRVSNPDK